VRCCYICLVVLVRQEFQEGVDASAITVFKAVRRSRLLYYF